MIRNVLIQPYFEMFCSLVEGKAIESIEGLSLVILGFQLLPLATSKLMGNHKEFDDSAIFWGVLLIVGLGKLGNIEDSSLIISGYQLLPLATSQSMQSFNYILMCFAFSLVWDRTHCAYEPPKWNSSLLDIFPFGLKIVIIFGDFVG